MCVQIADIWSLVETHCRGNEIIEVDYYTLYSYNRQARDNDRKGSGGIAIAVHTSVLKDHTSKRIYKGCEGQLGLKLRHNESGFLLGVFACYLQRESYKYGQDG